MLDFRGIDSPPMNNLVLRVVFISISRAEYILEEASFRDSADGEDRIWDMDSLRNFREETTDWSTRRVSSLLPAVLQVCFATHKERDSR